MGETRWPLRVAVLAGAAYIVGASAGAFDPGGASVVDDAVFLVGFVGGAALSLALGLMPRRLDSLIGLFVLTVALEWGQLNPFPAVVTIGFWLVGLAVRSDRGLVRSLRVRAYELETGRELYVAEAMRYERIRIARELHDVLAHSLSVIVIQASAGQRLPADDPGRQDLVAIIEDMTGQVSDDLDGLALLLDGSAGAGPALTRQAIDQLVQRAAATGATLVCTLPDDIDDIPVGTGAVVYRVLQEGVTNAIKHAPGAAIDVSIGAAPAVQVVGPMQVAGPHEVTSSPEGPRSIEVAVVNAPVRAWSGAGAVPGAGRGLAGLTERVAAVGGTFTSGPTAHGGWQLSARLPR